MGTRGRVDSDPAVITAAKGSISATPIRRRVPVSFRARLKLHKWPVEDMTRRHSENMEKHLKRWIGDLTPKQRGTVLRWSNELTRIDADRLDTRKRWQTRLRQLLRSWADTRAFRAGIYQLLVYPERT
jgi:hypothetical protein